MLVNPYANLPPTSFWKSGVAQSNPYSINGIYNKKYEINANTKIGTAGSCFAQHISRYLTKNGFNVLDLEPPPPGLPAELYNDYGFSMYSARYGNIYSVRQLLQLTEEVAGNSAPFTHVWSKNGRHVDALRPAIEPQGLGSPEEVVEHRKYHISRVKKLFLEMDLFIFTLGLTEMWSHIDSGTVFPTAPGTLAGEFDDNKYKFVNANVFEIVEDFHLFQKSLKEIRGGKSCQILLTVSPVPLTASASNNHVLVSTAYSKSTLRSAAGFLAGESADIDYFPSYEIVTNPRLHSTAFAENLRSVRSETVENVMSHFFKVHRPPSDHNPDKRPSANLPNKKRSNSLQNLQCEEAMMEAFNK